MELNLRAGCNRLGYGKIAQNIILPLQQLGVKVNYFHIGNIEVDSERQDICDSISLALKGQDDYDSHAVSLLIWHQHSLAERIGRGLHVGWPVFELDRFTKREKHHLENCDKLFVCSGWAKSIIEKNYIDVPTYVVPLGVDRTIFYPKNDPYRYENKTTFLNIGKWEKRKGHDILPQIFKDAFPTDNVELWMMCENPFYSDDVNLEWKKKYYSVLGNRVRFIVPQNTSEAVASIINQADCGIFPSRGEGFNLPLLEMMSCGKQVVTLNYSAITEFCNEKNSHLVNIDRLEIAHDGIWFSKENGGLWAEIGPRQVEKFVEILRKMHLDKQSGRDIINIEGITTAEKFSWANSAKLIRKILWG